jgi:hypothetical protein
MAFQAITLGEYDERFFALMPKIFPYNRFTMTVSSFLPPSPSFHVLLRIYHSRPVYLVLSDTTNQQKLIKRLVYQPHYDYLMKQQDEKLAELKKVADEGFDKAQEEWERSVKMWRESPFYFTSAKGVKTRTTYSIVGNRSSNGSETSCAEGTGTGWHWRWWWWGW